MDSMLERKAEREKKSRLTPGLFAWANDRTGWPAAKTGKIMSSFG